MGSCSSKKDRPMIIGHRGAMGYETENTLASVAKAMELGVDMIEIDVFRIKSGEIVVFHDERVDRLANSGGRIEEYYVVEMRRLTLDGGHQIPLLQEVLRLVDNKVDLNIELKGADTADKVHFIVSYYIEKYGWTPDRFLISSFNWEELKKYRAKDPDARIAVLVEGDPMEALEIATELKAEAINPNYTKLNAENIARIHQEGFKVYAWTVNDPADFQQLKAIGVDAVFSNYPDKMQ